MRKVPAEQRFWAKVQRTEGCWEWQAGRSNRGYGWFWTDAGQISAHRYSYALAYGPIPAGLAVCHRCDNPRCVRPDHLFLGTVADNNKDRQLKGRYGRRIHPPRPPKRERLSLKARFWSKVERGDGCWEWRAGRSRGGQGAFNVAGVQQKAHRFAWEQTYGPIPAGKVIYHSCGNRGCVRPDHLYLDRPGQKLTKKARVPYKRPSRAKGPHDCRGEGNGNAKLSWPIVCEIRTLRATGEYTLKQLSERFGIDKSHVSLIVNHKIWQENRNA